MDSGNSTCEAATSRKRKAVEDYQPVLKRKRTYDATVDTAGEGRAVRLLMKRTKRFDLSKRRPAPSVDEVRAMLESAHLQAQVAEESGPAESNVR